MPTSATAGCGPVPGRPSSAVRLLPGQDDRYRARAGHGAPGLLPVRRVRAWRGPQRRRARDRERVDVTRGAEDGCRTATAVPFATAAGLLAELAGVGLTVKRVERAAEADGAAAFALLGAEADAICSRQLVPLPPAPARTCSTSPSMAPAFRWCPRQPRTGLARPRTAGTHPRGQDGMPVHPDHHR